MPQSVIDINAEIAHRALQTVTIDARDYRKFVVDRSMGSSCVQLGADVSLPSTSRPAVVQP